MPRKTATQIPYIRGDIKTKRMKKKEFIEKYGEEAWERRLEYWKQHYHKHKEERGEYDKQHYMERKEDIREQYYTPSGRANHLVSNYNQADRDRGFDISQNITPEWVVSNVFSGQVCTYCSEDSWMKLGVDRIDNSLPHTPSNCVPCCRRCNSSRGSKSVDEYRDYLQGRGINTKF